MAPLGNKLRTVEGGRIAFWCPGCKESHVITTGIWTFNGDIERPTFIPSVLVTSGHYCTHHKAGDHCWCTYNKEHPDNPAPFVCYRCHSHVNDGKIIFLADCTHEYAGKTVELGPFPA